MQKLLDKVLMLTIIKLRSHREIYFSEKLSFDLLKGE